MENKSPVLVCITAQLRCEKLINVARDMARKLNCKMTVVTIQGKTAEPQRRARELKCLNTLSRLCDCDINIIYSDNVIHSLAAYIDKCKPCHILIGNPDKNGTFYNEFIKHDMGAPVSVVDDKILYTVSA